jgi:hypothetical protein
MKAFASPLRGLPGILCLMVCLSLAPGALSQRVIELSHPRNGQPKIIYVGNRVAYRLTGDNPSRVRSGKLEAINENGLWIGERYIPADSLEYIGKKGSTGKLLTGIGSVLAGSVMIASIGRGNNLGLPQYIAGQALVGTGIIQTSIQSVRLIKNKKHGLTSGWQIRIINFQDLYPEDEEEIHVTQINAD